MRELTLGGLHDDSDHVVLLDSEGERYTLRIDEALRAAVRRDRSSLGLIQSSNDSTLRPKDIQALLRSGSSVESIAELSGLSEDHIRRFEGPVKAERMHIARRAQTFRPGRGATQTLGDIVTSRLAARYIDGEPSWDAWRRSDGTWTLHLEFVAGGKTRTATWHVDIPNRVASPEDDEARWLTDGDAPSSDSAAAVRLASTKTHVFDVESSAPQPERSAAPRPISEAQIDELNARRGTPAPAAGASPWQSLDEAAESSTRAQAPSLDGEDERPAPVRIVPKDAIHHDPSVPSDELRTEEVSYIEPPEDLARSMSSPHSTELHRSQPSTPEHQAEPDGRGDETQQALGDEFSAQESSLAEDEREAAEPEGTNDPAHDPAATAPEDASDDDLDVSSDEEDAEGDAGSEDGNPEENRSSASPQDVDTSDLTPLPGFDAAPAPKPAKYRKGRASIPSWDDIVFGRKDK